MAQEAYSYPNDGGTFVWNTAIVVGYPASGLYTPFPDARGPIEGYPVNQPGFTRLVYAQRIGRRLAAIFVQQPPVG